MHTSIAVIGLVLAAGFALATGGCAPTVPEASSAKRVRAQCPSPNDDEYYFPAGMVIPSNDESDAEQRAAYATYLRAMQATTLSCGDELTETYRAMWFSSHGSALIAELVRDMPGWRMTVSSFRRRTRDAPRVEFRRDVTSAQAEAFLGHLRRTAFWTMPAWDVEETNFGDGACWVVEGRFDRGYKIVSRISPFHSSFKDAALVLFRIAGIRDRFEWTVAEGLASSK